MFRRAQRSVWLPLSMSLTASSRLWHTPHVTLSSCSPDEGQRGGGKKDKSFLDVIRDRLSKSTPPPDSPPPDVPVNPLSSSFAKFDAYTQDLMKTIRMPDGTSILGDKSDFSEYDFLDLIPNAILDDCTKTSLRDMSRVSENIVSQFQNTVTNFNHPFLVNLGLLRLYSIKCENERRKQILDKATPLEYKATPSQSITRNASETAVFLTTVRHFMRFADDVYEDQSSLYLAPSDIIDQELGDIQNPDGSNKSLPLPRYVVFFDHLTKCTSLMSRQSVVVVIRGTASVSDVITDLHCSTRPFVCDFMHAHAGMAAAAEKLLPCVQKALDNARNQSEGAFDDYKVVVTGHSLGAGTACLLSVLLADRLPLEQITTFAFAPPPIMAVDGKRNHRGPPPSVLHQAVQTLLHPPSQALPAGSPPLPRNLTIHSFVLNQDLIPRCSMHEFINMLSAVRAIDQDTKWTSSKRARLLLQGELDDDDMQVLNEVLSSSNTRKKDPKEELDPSEDFQLVIPGHLYWILPRESEISPHSCYHDGQAFDLVRLHSCHDVFTGSLFTGDDMFRDHLAGSYKDAMLSIGSAARVKK